jgi:hypothetical protein
MEPLHRTGSHESRKSRRSSSGASFSHPLSLPLLDNTQQYAEADRARLSSAGVKRASISMPLESNTRLHVSPQQQARRPSRANSEHNLLTTVLQAHIMASSSLPDSSAIIDDNDATPTQTHHNSEPILNLAPPRQDTDDSSRSSFSGLYQLGSALYDRALGAVSTASSVAGSETDGASIFVSPTLVPLCHFHFSSFVSFNSCASKLCQSKTSPRPFDPIFRHCACAPPSQRKNNSPFLTHSSTLI